MTGGLVAGALGVLGRLPWLGDALALPAWLVAGVVLAAMVTESAEAAAAGKAVGPALPDLSDPGEVVRTAFASGAAAALALAPVHVYRHVLGGGRDALTTGLAALGLLLLPGALASVVGRGLAGLWSGAAVRSALARPLVAGGAWLCFLGAWSVATFGPLGRWPGGRIADGALVVYLALAGAAGAGSLGRAPTP